jgi:hypothetical protein
MAWVPCEQHGVARGIHMQVRLPTPPHPNMPTFGDSRAQPTLHLASLTPSLLTTCPCTIRCERIWGSYGCPHGCCSYKFYSEYTCRHPFLFQECMHSPMETQPLTDKQSQPDTPCIPTAEMSNQAPTHHDLNETQYMWQPLTR